MKQLVYGMCVLLVTAFTTSAQNTEGEIVYEEKVNIHRQIPDERAHLKSQMPEYNTQKFMLYFNAHESYYTRKPREEGEANEQGLDDRRRRRRLRRFTRGRSGQNLYTNFAEKHTKEAREFFGKKFLIEGTPQQYAWKFTGAQKQVGAYLCQQASYSDSTMAIDVWFTPMIPVPAGPSSFSGLPGMILHVDMNDGERQFTAIEINLGALDEGRIQQPTEGERVTHEEFREIAEEKRKEMEAEYGGRSRRFRRG